MEKKLFAFFIPLCIIGFVGFWISTMFVGKYDVTISASSGVKDTGGDNWGITHSLANEGFTAEMIANPIIELDLSNVSAVVEPYEGTNIMVEARNTSQSKLKVELERNGDESSHISISTYSVFDFGFGLFKFNLFDGFGDNISKRNVTIKIPSNYTYEKLTIEQGSGETKVTGINALENDIDIGSGKLTYEKDSSFTSDRFKIDLGSGDATFKGIHTKNYEIDLGSGHLKVENLTGQGEIDMGSGHADIRFDDSPNGILDMGSGYMKMTIPKETSTTFKLNIGSGSIDIEKDDHVETYGHLDYKDVVLGTGNFKYIIDLGSGNIDIGYASKETESVTEVKGPEPGVVQSSYSQSESAEPA